MATARLTQQLLSLSGKVRSQPPGDWTGPFPIPPEIERFYREVGPEDVWIESYGNPFFVPSLAGLWGFQAGYRWNGLTGEPITGWQSDWLVVASHGGDPFIFSLSAATVAHAEHGRGTWEPRELFPDLFAMATCLSHLGVIAAEAGEGFTDGDCCIRQEWRVAAAETLRPLLGSQSLVDAALEALGWG